MTIQITKRGVLIDAGGVEALRGQFRERHCVRIPGLISPELLAAVLAGVDRSEWRPNERKGLYVEEVLAAGGAVDLLHFLANWPEFLGAIHDVTEAGPFTWFGGRVYRMLPGSGHLDAWHSDRWEGRLVGMSVNLGRPYAGGRFQLRLRDTDSLLADVANTGPGDAILFRISDALVHRVTPVESGEAKCAFAGWFEAAAPTLAARLRRPADA